MSPEIFRKPAALALVATALALIACGGNGDESTTVSGVPAGGATGASAATDGPRFSDPTNIDNPYAPLTAHRVCTYEGTDEGQKAKSVHTVLDRTETFTVAGNTVEAVVIQDRAFLDGELIEVAKDYTAQADDGAVYYFGEDVNYYENGKLTNHKGSFRYGEDTQNLGILMPADPQVGDTWKFEDVPGITVETDKVADPPPRLTVGGETYTDVLRIDADVQPDNERESKYYAKGTGVVREVGPGSEKELTGCV
jgi:hypothetical protein